jgi:hypothetical protein
MRASELIGSPVFDESGRPAGMVRDLRLADDRSAASTGFPIVGLVLSAGGPLAAGAHAWGFAEGRSAGPAPLRALFAGAVESSTFVTVDRVLDWGPERLRISGRADDLPRLRRRQT